MKNNLLVFFLLVVIIVLFLWIIGIIPKMIGINTAKKYVEENYSHMDLQYDTIEFSKAYDDYIVRFVDERNIKYNFKVAPKILPVQIMYDSIKNGV